MRPRSPLALITAAALLTSAAPPPVAKVRPVQPDHSPVRCRATDDSLLRPTFGRPRGKGFRGNPVAPPPVMAPMPAPPPPPPPMAASGDVVVTGTKVQQQSYTSPTPVTVIAQGNLAPYGAHENTERYDGKPVAAIQDVAAAPVSTFSVDVDTGSYANVRRFLNSGEPVPADAVRTEEMINYFRYDYPRPATTAEPFSITTDVARTPWNPDTRLLRIGLRAYDVPSASRPPANLVFLVDTQPADARAGRRRARLCQAAL